MQFLLFYVPIVLAPYQVMWMLYRCNRKEEYSWTRRSDFCVDESYILYSVGLLSDVSPTKTLRVGKKYLKKL